MRWDDDGNCLIRTIVPRCAYPFLGYSMTIIASKVSSSSSFFLFCFFFIEKRISLRCLLYLVTATLHAAACSARGVFAHCVVREHLGNFSSHAEHAVRQGGSAVEHIYELTRRIWRTRISYSPPPGRPDRRPDPLKKYQLEEADTTISILFMYISLKSHPL